MFFCNTNIIGLVLSSLMTMPHRPLHFIPLARVVCQLGEAHVLIDVPPNQLVRSQLQTSEVDYCCLTMCLTVPNAIDGAQLSHHARV